MVDDRGDDYLAVYNEYGKLEEVLLCRPSYFKWEPINEIARVHIKQANTNFDHDLVMREHDELVEAFQDQEVQVRLVPEKPGANYQTFTRDIGKNTPNGVLLGNLRAEIRRGEELIAREVVEKAEVTILESKVETGFFEGGDVHFIDGATLAVGVGARTNMQGIREAAGILKTHGIKLIPVPFEEQYLHLDLLFVVVAEKVCLLCPELLPEEFLQALRKKGYQMITTREEEVAQLKNNLLAIDENTLLSFDENKRVNKKLEAFGFEVIKPSLSMFTRGGGGPRGLSFPLKRQLG